MTQLLIDRATLEQLVAALEAVLDDSKYANELTVTGGVYEGLQCKEALTAGRAALAQQELPQKERPDFMVGYDAGMADAKRMAQHRKQQPVCHGCGIPAGDVHMRTCKSGKWPSRVSNGDTAAPAPQAQDALQDIAAYIGVGGYNGATTEQLSERIRVEFDRLATLQSAQPVDINGMVEAATRPAIDDTNKQGGQHE